MRKFKVGDSVICTSAISCELWDGALYEVARVCDGYITAIRINPHKVISVVDSVFVLADKNPMPKLESGMVVEVLCKPSGVAYKFLYVNDDMLVGIDDEWDELMGYEVLAVWGQDYGTLSTMINETRNSNPIWQKETEAQKTLRELKELQEETNKKIAELEEVVQ